MLVSLILPLTASAASFVTLFSNFPMSSNSPQTVTSTTWLATPFVPTVSGSGKLVSVFTQCLSDGNTCYPGLLSVSIYADVNGHPGAVPLATSETFQPGRDAPVKADCMEMPNPPALTAGTSYWAVMRGTTSFDHTWYKGSSLTSVNTMRSTDSGGTWAPAATGFSLPFSFRIDDGDHCDPHMVPNPDAGTVVGGMAPRSGEQDVQTITLANEGLGDLELTSYSITGTDPSVFKVTTENVKDSPTAKVFPQQHTLIPNGLVILYVTCTGPEADGHYVATLTFNTNDPEQPEISWPLSCYVDNTPPALFVTPDPKGANGWYTTLPAVVTAIGLDGEHGSGTNYIACDVNGSPFFIKDDGSVAFVGVTVPPAFEGLASDGSANVIACTAHDVAGNVTPAATTATFKIDSHLPVISVLVDPESNAVGWHRTDATVSFSCADPVPGSGLDTNTVGGGGTYTDETDGTEVTNTGGCADVAGNVGAPETVTLKIDKTTPATDIKEGPAPRTADDTATFALGGTDALSGVASFVCQLDDGTASPCSSDTPSFPGLIDGAHTLQAWAVDLAGNTDPVGDTWSWYVDTSPPVVEFDSPAEGAITRASGSITFHATDPDDDDFIFLCEFDGGPADECTSPFDYTALDEGPHELTVTALDGMSNASTPVTRNVVVDATPPTVTVNEAAHQADPTSTSPIRFTAVFSERVAGFVGSTNDVSLSGTAGATTVEVTPILGSNFTRFDIEVSGMTLDGTVIVSVRAAAATDAAGNGNTASTSTDNTVTFDAPAPPVNDPPSATNDGYTPAEDQALTVAAPGVLATDTDIDGDSLTSILVSGPSHGSLTLNANGSFSYSPAANFNGTDTFTYKANDGTADSATATVTLTVTSVNDPPSVVVAVGGSCSSGSGSGQVNLTLDDVDTALTELTLSGASSDTRLVPNGNITFGGSGATRTVAVATVPQRSIKTARVTITVGDGQASGAVVITVVVGTERNETINGSAGADMLFGLTGSNTMNGNAGTDLMCGGNGADVMNGGDGPDTIDGENGNDMLNGGAENDILRGSGGLDGLTGGLGADSFSGGGGIDTAIDFSPAQGDTQDGTIP